MSPSPSPLQPTADRISRVVALALVAALSVLGTLTLAAPAGAALPAPTATATDDGTIAAPAGIPALNRDCGLSTKLSDGTVLWVFCDSFYTSNTGQLHATLSNTAALASPWAPTTPIDHTSTFLGEVNLNADAANPGGVPFIALPGGGTFPCDNGYRKAWPVGMVNVPKGGPNGADRVLVWYARVCDDSNAVGSFHFVHQGIGLAEWNYTPGSFNPAVGVPEPLVATTILNDTLFGATTPYGSGATLSSDASTVYVYRCDTNACYAGRVAVGQVASASAYRWWNGSSWGTAAAQAMPMPSDSFPMAQFTVDYVPQVARYVMTYTACTARCLLHLSDQLAIRTALTPHGPWSDPVVVTLPGCTAESSATPCRAAAAHAEQSGTALDLSWFRTGEGAAPSGRLHTGSLPFAALSPFALDADVATTSASSSATFTFGSADYSSFECSLDNATYRACTSPYTVGPLTQGNHQLGVRGVRSNGSRTWPQIRVWTVDLTAPGASISTRPARTTTDTSATLAFSGIDSQTPAAELRFECALDTAPFAPCTSPVTTPALVPGDHTFALRSVDRAGNRSATSSATWTETFAFTGSAPPAATLGAPYSVALATNASALGPVSYALTAGELPPGLSVGRDGTLAGTPTNAGTFGPATVTATAAWGTTTTTFSIAVSPSIAGRVTNAVTGVPAVGIRVQAFNSLGYLMGTAFTAADGSYQIGNLTAGTYRLSFWDPTGGYVLQYWTGQSSLTTANELVTTNGSTTTADIGLAPLLAVTGRVTDRVSGAALAGMRVTLYDAAGTPILLALTGADGSYRFSGLAPAAYRLMFADPTGGHTVEYFTQATSLATSTSVGTAGGGTVVADEAMVPLTRITGRVTDQATGGALAGTWVRLFDGTGTATLLARTGADGTYSFGNLAPGTYYVSFVDGTGTRPTQYWSGATSLATATPIVAVGGTFTADAAL